MSYRVREPRLEDADALGRVHVRAWLGAYRGGLMPDSYLDSLSEAERASMWRAALTAERRPRAGRLVADSGDHGVVGFAVFGPAGGDPDAVVGELYAINVDPDHWGTGAGRLLFDSAVETLAATGFPSAVLWVHPANARARRFYESAGWVCDDVVREQEVLGVEVPEIRYSTELVARIT